MHIHVPWSESKCPACKVTWREPRGKGPCLFGSDQAILDGRLTDNQSISNLTVIFQ